VRVEVTTYKVFIGNEWRRDFLFFLGKRILHLKQAFWFFWGFISLGEFLGLKCVFFFSSVIFLLRNYFLCRKVGQFSKIKLLGEKKLRK
jgi:hypothetical protein